MEANIIPKIDVRKIQSTKHILGKTTPFFTDTTTRKGSRIMFGRFEMGRVPSLQTSTGQYNTSEEKKKGKREKRSFYRRRFLNLNSFLILEKRYWLE